MEMEELRVYYRIICSEYDIVSSSREILEKRFSESLKDKVKITDNSYELNFSKLSSSKRDSDQNSEYDKLSVA